MAKDKNDHRKFSPELEFLKGQTRVVGSYLWERGKRLMGNAAEAAGELTKRTVYGAGTIVGQFEKGRADAKKQERSGRKKAADKK
ncbi:MAG: hypothetical protein HYW89_01105 [Candidatus Sungiibacteriota bacterium]|uniref:Uncharacterized protein n=1 Tax=Candidatus Sungiibacteriota bacterium TaxID=2750080 RepID=A0A7T5UQW0_9BACT|nr:MAG: hypothetical protein HYW89_01105 [Candidatus Sungbacteria bacterium]